jgi:purine-nucleoside phosphorylase
MSEFEKQIEEAHQFVASAWPTRPKFGIILGTGAGILGNEISADVAIPYGEIPHFPHSTSIGHKGQLVCGSLNGIPVAAMQGRFHLYEGYDVDQATLPIHMMHAMGVEVLFVSNASGGINPRFKSGEMMLIESHVDFMYQTSRRMTGDVVADRPLLRSDSFYDRELMEQAAQYARKENFMLQRGVYGAMLGPNYETRAEYRFLRKIGADVAGMSTVPEVAVASRCGIRILALSIVSNVANPDVLESTSGQEVIDAAVVAAPRLKGIVLNAMETVLANSE